MIVNQASRRLLLLVSAFIAVGAPAWPCTVIAPLPSPQALVGDADIIVRARVDAVVPGGSPGGFGTSTNTRITFVVIDTLKGAPPTGSLQFNGISVNHDDPNDRPVPYDFVRPGGRGGNCFALEYRFGAEYLLLLKRSKADAPEGELTPYWAALSPTNEQLFGGKDDPWYLWVRRHLAATEKQIK